MVIFRFFSLLILVNCWVAVRLQAQTPPTWSRGVQLGGLLNDQVLATATDASGNTYQTGYFVGTTQCGTSSLTMANDATYDMYLVKLDAQGNVVWARQAGSQGNTATAGLAQGSQIALDATGNVYVSGFFKGNVTFGSTATTLASTGASAAGFLVKYAPQGSVLWTRKAQGTTNVDATGLTLTTNGDLFVAGSFTGTITLGTTNFTTFVSQNSSSDVYLAKYNTNGDFQWAQTARGPDFDLGYNLQPGPANSVYLTGIFTSSLSVGTVSVAGNGQTDDFIAQFDNAGNVQWLKAFGGPGAEYGSALAIAPTGEIYCAGTFSNTVQFGSQTLTSAGGLDGFLLKCTAQGVPIWVRQMGGTGNDYAYLLQRQTAGALYVGGSFVGTGTFGSQILTSAGSDDGFLARYDAGGTFLWATQAGGPQSDNPGGLSLSGGGGIEFSIQFKGTAQFGALTATSRGNSDVLFCHLQDNTALAVPAPALLAAVTVYPNPLNELAFNLTGLASRTQVTTVRLRDLAGKTVWEQKVGPGIVATDKLALEVAELSNGTYLVEISGEEGNVTKKLIIRR